MWMPLVDCPAELGGLAVLAGSHTLGILPVHAATGAGGIGITTDKLGLSWHTSNFAAGDILLFHSHTIHKALPNVTSNRLRISVDYRYQGVSQPIVEDGLYPHYGRLTWEEIYQGWARQDLQYYWQSMNLQTVERDPSLREEEH
jgi:ectoine hydroxylase-related dioxygenase (phytanoyl-CoA dioxygenase family)